MEELKMALSIPKDATEEYIQEQFKLLAKKLLSEYVIIKGEKTYRIIELEFYFYNKNHPDKAVYKRIIESGRWYSHLSGIDISFESREEYYGGVLIRSLVSSKNEITNGPLSSFIELFRDIDIEGKGENVPYIIRKDTNYEVNIKSTKRYNIQDNLKYCYYDASASIKWKSNYNGNPHKREDLSY